MPNQTVSRSVFSIRPEARRVGALEHGLLDVRSLEISAFHLNPKRRKTPRQGAFVRAAALTVVWVTRRRGTRVSIRVIHHQWQRGHVTSSAIVRTSIADADVGRTRSSSADRLQCKLRTLAGCITTGAGSATPSLGVDMFNGLGASRASMWNDHV